MKTVPLNTLLDEWIKIMTEVVDNKLGFDMNSWQKPLDGAKWSERLFKLDIAEFHECGSSACGGGYLAVSEFWKSLGGTINTGGNAGAPMVIKRSTLTSTGPEAVLLAIKPECQFHTTYEYLCQLMHSGCEVYGEPQDRYHRPISSQDFLDALIRWRETGSPYLNQGEDE